MSAIARLLLLLLLLRMIVVGVIRLANGVAASTVLTTHSVLTSLIHIQSLACVFLSPLGLMAQ